jgi:dTDP-glucose pyrophosphorylase
MYRKDIKQLFISPSSKIQDAIRCIDQNVCGIALSVDDENHLLGTITDGDIRRAILAGVNLLSPVTDIFARKSTSPYPKPITAAQGTESTILIDLMRKRAIRQVPLLNDNDQVVDLVLMEDLIPGDDLPLQAVIMAGGFGTRLRPLTEDIPKPLLPVGDQPLMELIVSQLRNAGIRRIHVTTHYMADRVKEYFGSGNALGVEIQYVNEKNPLGTAGALGLISPPSEPLLVINGDILTKLDFRAMLKYHQKHKAELTVAVRQYGFQVPYGVIECEGSRVLHLQEKPTYNFFVNAGIYLVQPGALENIPQGRHFDMTDLIQALVKLDRTIVAFPIVEYWLDIGQTTDYEQAQKDISEGKFFLGSNKNT